jgi:hypothetical protein
MRLRGIVLTALLVLPTICFAADNERLRTIMYADQAERQAPSTQPYWKGMMQRDAERRVQVKAELVAGRVRTSADFYNAALVMQHGQGIEDIRMAHAFATIAASLDPLDRSARWLKAASWDRMMTTMNKPQWYGTQYTRDANGKWLLLPMDETAVTDAQRMELATPTLAEAKKRVEDMNRAK